MVCYCSAFRHLHLLTRIGMLKIIVLLTRVEARGCDEFEKKTRKFCNVEQVEPKNSELASLSADQVLRSMNRAAKEAAPVGDAESSSSGSSVAAADKERRVDFRKYLQRRRIERAKQERMADRTWQRRVNETNRLALAGDDRQSDDWSDNTLDDYLDEEPLR